MFLKRYLSLIQEVILILAVIFVVNNFLGNKEVVIKADGKGYYDYLPAAFIYNDLNFTYTDTLQTKFYDHKTQSQGYLKTVNEKQINKYFPGVSMLWTPFFFGAHMYALNSDYPADGYSEPYQKSIFYAAVFFLFLGLVYVRKWLTLFNVPLFVIFILQGLLVFATPVIHYVQFDPSFTHVYSFSLISCFAYYVLRYTRDMKSIHLFVAAILLGFIVIIRPVNLLVIGVLLFSFSSLEELKEFSAKLFSKHYKSLLVSVLLFCGVVSLVPIIWFFQTGSFFIWGYQDEGFNFMNPAFVDFLFSFRKGVFTHTPILFILFFGGLLALGSKKEWYKMGAYLGVFTVVVYVLSSWWAWWYGASMGSRPMIDYYIIFAFGGAYLYRALKSWWSKIAITVAMVLLVPVNIIQAYQYQNYIMDWDEMTFDKFQKIGLNTDMKYMGMFFQPTVKYIDNDVVFFKKFEYKKPVHLAGTQYDLFSSTQINESVDMAQVTHIVLDVDVDYQEGTGKIVIAVDDSLKPNVYWQNTPIFQIAHEDYCRKRVSFVYKVNNLPNNCTIQFGASTKNDELNIYSVELRLISL